MEENVTTRSLLRYPGGKYRARKTLESHIPDGTKRIISPFFGGGSFELHMTGKGVHVTACDVFASLSNFWECVLSNPATVAAICDPYIGNVDKDVFKTMQQELVSWEETHTTTLDYDIAAKFFIVNRCSFSGATLSGGFSKDASTSRFNENAVQRVKAFTNPLCRVEHNDFLSFLSSWEKTEGDMLFLDPPYYLSKEKNILYGISGSLHKDFPHEKLYSIVRNLDDVPFILTYNNCDAIYDLWSEYNIQPASWSYGMNSTKQSSEVIITNF